MTLQNKTLLIISLCVIGTIGTIYLISKIIVSNSFQEMENSYARDNTRRVLEVLNNELNFLSTAAGIYANRENLFPVSDGYNTNTVIAESPYGPLERTDLNLYAVFTAGEPTYAGRFSGSTVPGQTVLPDPWQRPMSPDHPLFIPRSPDGSAHGLLKLEDGRALLLASSPVSSSSFNIQLPASVVIGKLFDSDELQRLSRVSNLSLRLIDLDQVDATSDMADFYNSLTVNAPNRIRIRDERVINGFLLLKDINNQPVYVLEVSLPRDIYQQGQAAQDYFTKLLIIVAVATVIIVLVLMNQLVLSRLRDLKIGITRVHTTGDLTSHIELRGNDELTQLADIFNDLLESLHGSQQELEKQINERIAAEQTINISQERYNRAELIGKLGHWEWNEIDDCMITCSEQFALIYGINVEQAIKQFNSRDSILESIHEDDREHVQAALEEARIRRQGMDIECRIYTHEGNLHHVHWISEPVTDRRGVLVRSIGTLQDITRQHQVQARLELYQSRLRVLMSELALTEEQQRRKIAGDLHDSTIQNLGLSKFKLSVFQNTLPEDISTDILNEVIETIDKAINDTRNLVFELSPPILYELGFVPAIEWLAERIYIQRNLVCEVYNDEHDKPLDTPMMVSLFQIVRELLINISKHARATRASILIDRIDDKIRIQVTDNGVGFDASNIEDPTNDLRGYGLFSIRERLSNMGESLNIQSTAKEGTRIVFSVPLYLENEVIS